MNTTVEPEPEGSSGSLFARMVAFLVLAGGFNLWTGHHLGMGLQDPKILGGLGALLAGGISILERIADKQAKESFWNRVRGWMQPLLSWPLLVVLYLLVGVVVLSYSSITLLPAQAGERLSASVRAVALQDYERKGEAPSADAPLLIPVQITAFGRVFRVEADGYLPDEFEVPPLTGRLLRAGRDLRPLPSLILRPSPGALTSLASGGCLTIKKVSSEELREPILECTRVDAASRPKPKGASFLVGRSQPIPADLQSRWRLELTSQGVDPTRLADTLLQWMEPQVVSTTEPLKPEMKLQAEIWSRAAKLKARAIIIVGADRLTDIPMTDVRDGS